MSNILKFATAGLLVTAMAVSIIANPLPVGAVDTSDGVSSGLAATGQADSAAQGGDVNAIITSIINTMLWLIGILSVVYLIYGGIKYTTSAGDSNKVTSAKNTIMYALIGLIVAIFAYAIVNFVVMKATGA